jgi:hypothetical protein
MEDAKIHGCDGSSARVACLDDPRPDRGRNLIRSANISGLGNGVEVSWVEVLCHEVPGGWRHPWVLGLDVADDIVQRLEGRLRARGFGI